MTTTLEVGLILIALLTGFCVGRLIQNNRTMLMADDNDRLSTDLRKRERQIKDLNSRAQVEIDSAVERATSELETARASESETAQETIDKLNKKIVHEKNNAKTISGEIERLGKELAEAQSKATVNAGNKATLKRMRRESELFQHLSPYHKELAKKKAAKAAK